jgi:ParB family chromosome partitioning protein
MPPKPREAAKLNYLGLSAQDTTEIVLIELAQLRANPFQPRKEFADEAIRELAQSIETHGLLQPILVVKDKEGRAFTIVAGERRVRAHQALGRTHIEAVIKEAVDLAEVALIENLQRSDLSPLEEAEGLAVLRERHGYSFADLAAKLGKAKSTIAETVAIAGLPKTILDAVRTSERPVSKSLLIELTRAGNEAERLALWERIKGGATVAAARSERDAEPKRFLRQAIEKALASGERFARILSQMDASDLRAATDYQRLLELQTEIGEAMRRLREHADGPR